MSHPDPSPQPPAPDSSGEIGVLVPAYNEGAGLERALTTIAEVLETCAAAWEILVVDDGSRDDTFERLRGFAAREPRVRGLSFSRNFGKEAAILAGLRHSRGQAVIVIDAVGEGDAAVWADGTVHPKHPRREKVIEGSVPLHTLRADVDFHTARAQAPNGGGIIGVKVWIYKGERNDK